MATSSAKRPREAIPSSSALGVDDSVQEPQTLKPDSPKQEQTAADPATADAPKYHITQYIRENTSNSILDVSAYRVPFETEPKRDLFLTIQPTQANVYEGKHLDLASHFNSEPNEHVPTVEDITATYWIPIDPEVNDAWFALGTNDGIVHIISIAECKVRHRLGETGKGRHIVDICARTDSPYQVTVLVEDDSGVTQVDIWDVRAKELLSSFTLTTKAEFRRVQYLPGTNTIVITSEDCMYFFSGGEEVSRLKLRTPAADIRFITQSQALLLFNTGAATIFNIESLIEKVVFPTTALLTCICISKCGNYVAAGDELGHAYIVDIRELEKTISLRSNKTKACYMTSCCFSSDAPSELVCASSDGSLWRWVLSNA